MFEIDAPFLFWTVCMASIGLRTREILIKKNVLSDRALANDELKSKPIKSLEISLMRRKKREKELTIT